MTKAFLDITGQNIQWPCFFVLGGFGFLFRKKANSSRRSTFYSTCYLSLFFVLLSLSYVSQKDVCCEKLHGNVLSGYCLIT